MRKLDYLLPVTAAVLITTGVILMIDGSLLGDSTTGVASVVGLVGILVILFASRRAAVQKAKKS